MKNLNSIKNILYTVIVMLLIVGAVFIVAGRFGIGGVRALVVQSGSMEPSIQTKSIVVTAPSDSYVAGDVITFKQSGRADVLVTHRVTQVTNSASGVEFTTKGDANEEADSEVVPARNVIGKVMFTVPYVGAIVSFAQTTPGFIAVIIIPAVLIVYSELMNIKKQIMQYLQKRKEQKLVRPLE